MDVNKIYDRILLLVIALAAIVFSVLMVLKAMKFKKVEFPTKVIPEQEVVPVEMGPTGQAMDALNKTVTWVRPTQGGKGFPSMLSTPRLLKEGDVFDMTQPEPKLRPPVPNAWLIEHKLSFLREDVLDMDEDGDGFTNLEEYKNKTNPYAGTIKGRYLDKDGKELAGADSHPPLMQKLMVVDRDEVPYEIELRSASGGQYNIRETKVPTEEMQKRSGFFRVGDELFQPTRRNATQLRFKILEEGEKEGPAPGGGVRMNPFLVLEDKKWSEKLVLNYREPLALPIYFAKFSYWRYGSREFTIERGKVFTLSEYDEGFGATKYKLQSVDMENGAVLIELDLAGEEVARHKIPVGKLKMEPSEEGALEEGAAPEEGADPAAPAPPAGAPAAPAPPVTPPAGATPAPVPVPAPAPVVPAPNPGAVPEIP